jgi:hypothetical protein
MFTTDTRLAFEPNLEAQVQPVGDGWQWRLHWGMVGNGVFTGGWFGNGVFTDDFCTVREVSQGIVS